MGQPGFWEQGASEGPRDTAPWGNGPHGHHWLRLHSSCFRALPDTTPKSGQGPGLQWGDSSPSTGSIHHTQPGRKRVQRTFFPRFTPVLTRTGHHRSQPGTECQVSGDGSAASQHEWLIFRKVLFVPWPHSSVSDATPSDSATQADSVQRIKGVPPTLLAGAAGSPSGKALQQVQILTGPCAACF